MANAAQVTQQALAAAEDPLQKLPLVPLFPLIDLDLALAELAVDTLVEAPEVRGAGEVLRAALPDDDSSLREKAETANRDGIVTPDGTIGIDRISSSSRKWLFFFLLSRYPRFALSSS